MSIGPLTCTSITLIDIFHKGPSGEIMACLCQGALFMENYPRSTNGLSIELKECQGEKENAMECLDECMRAVSKGHTVRSYNVSSADQI